jgi:phage gpG-like protein
MNYLSIPRSGNIAFLLMWRHAQSGSLCVEKAFEKEAKAAIGTYRFDWPALQPETIARITTGDSPLLETGELQASIGHVSGREGGEAVGYVGTNDPVAKYHELGTRTIPPRSFLGEAAMRKEHKIHEMAIARKTTGDSPLLETGELQASIGHVSGREGGEAVGYVGTNDPVAKYHELGTRTIPLRSFLGEAAMRKEHKIHEMELRMIAATFDRGGPHYRELWLMRAAKSSPMSFFPARTSDDRL